MEGKPQEEPLLTGALRWMAAFVNSWVHFLPLFVVGPFSKELGRRLYQSWARNSLRIFGITASLQDENDGESLQAPFLYVWLNQSNLAEGAISIYLLPPGFVVINIEYALMPLAGMARAFLGDVVIIRQWKRQAKRGIERAAARIIAGESGMISIEGARSADGSLLPYKKGPVVLAIKTQATIIPMVMHGGRDVLPPGTWRLRPGNVQLRLLKAIPVRGLSYEDRDEVMEQLRMTAEQALAGDAAQQSVAGDGQPAARAGRT